jgi:hypothetical protein
MTTPAQSAEAITPQEILTKRIGDLLVDGISVSDASDDNTALTGGRKEVAVAGVAEALAASTECKSVTIQAEFNNTGIIVVGGSGVIAAEATRVGLALGAEDSVTISIDDLAKIFLDTTVSTDGVTFIYFK